MRGRNDWSRPEAKCAVTSQAVVVVNQLGMHARAAAKFVHLATRFDSRVRVARDATGDRREEHHGHSAARRRARVRPSRLPRTAPTSATPIDALAALVESGFGEDVMRRLTGIGVSPGIVCGRAVILIQRAQVLRYQIAPDRARPRARAARTRAASGRASSCRTSARGSAGGADPELAALFDAQLLMLDDPMLVPRAADIVRRAARERRMGRPAGLPRIQRASSTRWPTRTCGSARATSPTSSGGCG